MVPPSTVRCAGVGEPNPRGTAKLIRGQGLIRFLTAEPTPSFPCHLEESLPRSDTRLARATRSDNDTLTHFVFESIFSSFSLLEESLSGADTTQATEFTFSRNERVDAFPCQCHFKTLQRVRRPECFEFQEVNFSRVRRPIPRWPASSLRVHWSFAPVRLACNLDASRIP